MIQKLFNENVKSKIEYEVLLEKLYEEIEETIETWLESYDEASKEGKKIELTEITNLHRDLKKMEEKFKKITDDLKVSNPEIEIYYENLQNYVKKLDPNYFVESLKIKDNAAFNEALRASLSSLSYSLSNYTYNKIQNCAIQNLKCEEFIKRELKALFGDPSKLGDDSEDEMEELKFFETPPSNNGNITNNGNISIGSSVDDIIKTLDHYREYLQNEGRKKNYPASVIRSKEISDEMQLISKGGSLMRKIKSNLRRSDFNSSSKEYIKQWEETVGDFKSSAIEGQIKQNFLIDLLFEIQAKISTANHLENDQNSLKSRGLTEKKFARYMNNIKKLLGNKCEKELSELLEYRAVYHPGRKSSPIYEMWEADSFDEFLKNNVQKILREEGSISFFNCFLPFFDGRQEKNLENCFNIYKRLEFFAYFSKTKGSLRGENQEIFDEMSKIFRNMFYAVYETVEAKGFWEGETCEEKFFEVIKPLVEEAEKRFNIFSKISRSKLPVSNSFENEHYLHEFELLPNEGETEIGKPLIIQRPVEDIVNLGSNEAVPLLEEDEDTNFVSSEGESETEIASENETGSNVFLDNPPAGDSTKVHVQNVITPTNDKVEIAEKGVKTNEGAILDTEKKSAPETQEKVQIGNKPAAVAVPSPILVENKVVLGSEKASDKILEQQTDENMKKRSARNVTPPKVQVADNKAQVPLILSSQSKSKTEKKSFLTIMIDWIRERFPFLADKLDSFLNKVFGRPKGDQLVAAEGHEQIKENAKDADNIKLDPIPGKEKHNSFQKK